MGSDGRTYVMQPLEVQPLASAGMTRVCARAPPRTASAIAAVRLRGMVGWGAALQERGFIGAQGEEAHALPDRIARFACLEKRPGASQLAR